MQISDFDFELPEELIASFPLEQRDGSRLLHYQRQGGSLKHRKFKDLPELLRKDDILVRNKSKVMPARLKLENTKGAKIEVLLIESLNHEKTFWRALVKPGKKIKNNEEKFYISEKLCVDISRKDDDFFIEFSSPEDFQTAVSQHGLMPLPPYMRRDADASDCERYQTIYAEDALSGASIAAPTAGLHFTQEINKQISDRGIKIIDTVLHVGIGTFAPIRSTNILDHQMHHEYYEINPDDWSHIQSAKNSGKRIIAIGSTSVRVLETVALTNATQGKTNIYIYPGFKFQITDAMITNFHLPKSSLILMISAFLGLETVQNIYKEAIREKYRFFSYGDCCFFE